MKKINKINLRTRYEVVRQNKILAKENKELCRNLNSKYWDSASVLLDYLFQNDVELYNRVHSKIFGLTIGKTNSPTHQEMNGWKIEREKEFKEQFEKWKEEL